MIPVTLNTQPPAIPPDGNRLWLDRIALCANSCARTIEHRKLAANEVPLLLGSLIVALADHSGVPLEKVIAMTSRHARNLKRETPQDLPS